MSSSPRLPNLTLDRGLFSPTSKQVKLGSVGPGTYSDETKVAFPSRMSSSLRPI